MSSGNIMKQNQTPQNEEKGCHWPTHSWSEHNSSQGGPPRGPQWGNLTAAAVALKEGNTWQMTTSPPVHSILENWLKAFIWASRESRSQSRWYEKYSEKKHILWSSINCAFNLDSWKASVAEGSAQHRFSFLTPRPLPSPAFSKKVKEYENQIDNSRTGQKFMKMKIMKT